MGKMIGRSTNVLSTRGRRKGRKGSVLIIALLFASVLCMMGVAYMGLIVSEAYMTPRSFSSIAALNLAEAGAEAALWELKYSGADFTNGEGWSGSGTAANPYTKTASLQTSGGVTAGTYSISAADITTAPKIEVTGYAPSTAQPEGVRRVRVTVKRDSSPFDYGLFSNTNLTMSGNGRSNSYNSGNGTDPATFGSDGNIASNSNITLSGNAAVYGNATPGPGCTVSTSGNAFVTGSTAPASSTVSLPAINTSSWPTGSSSLTVDGNNTVTLSTGTYAYTSINISGNGILTLGNNVKLYVGGPVSVSGNGIVSVSNNVTLCTTGNLSISGNGFSNTSHVPSNLMIYSTGSSVSFSGNAHLYGAVYAPSATVQLTGNGDVYGSIMGNSVSVTGNGNIHYDEALKNAATILPGTYSVATWQEK